MPDIEFRLTAIDEATPVIDRARAKMDQFNRSTASVQQRAQTQLGQTQVMPRKDPSGMGGMGGMLGGGKVGTMAGLTIIAQAALQVLQRIWKVLNEASPYLQSVSQQFKTATTLYLRPMGDAIARMLQPMSERALEKAEQRAERLNKIDEEWGPVGTILATAGFTLYDVQSALLEFSYGVWNALSKVYLWPIDKLGELIGVDLPGSLDELLEQVFGIKGGFQGIQDWMEGLPESLAGLGTEVWNGITGAFSDAWDEITGFGSWLYDSVTGVFNTAWTALTGFGTWLWGEITGVFEDAWDFLTDLGSDIYNGIWDKVKDIGGEAYKALHNAIASLLNSIANIELPLVGKPFKGLFGTIPMLASGGIVTQPTLAMIGERGAEAVIPLNKAGQLGMGQGMNVTIQMNAPVYGVDDLERTIRDLLSREQLSYSGYR